MVRLIIRRRVGRRGQIVIPKVFRESLGIKPGGEVIMEVREEGLLIRPGVDPEKFVEEFCATTGEKLTSEIDLKKILEEEVEGRIALC